MLLCLINFVEDIESENPEFSFDVPRLLFGYFIVYETLEPIEQNGVVMCLCYYFSDCLCYGFDIVQVDIEPRAFAEFAGKIAEYPLEEAVDGAYVEIAVVVQYL